VSTLKIIPVTTVAEGADPVVLASHGPFTVRGGCSASGAEVTVSTTESGAEVVVPPSGDAYTVAPIGALAASGKAFTGEVGLTHDPSANVCRFHGSLALQG
jgi:hypothetical protein